jgi:hypothetical protein
VWAKKLTAKYHELPAIALRKLMDETYKPQDLLRDRSPAEWCMKVKRLCQDAELGGNDQQYAAQCRNL